MAAYQRPDWFTRRVINPAAALLMRFGVSVRGSRVLAVRGRRTAAWRTTPVNPLPFEGGRYLVAPRGTTQWVRNIRVAGGGELRLGRTREAFRVRELADDEKPELLRAYLRLWAWEASKFFGGAGADAADDELRRIAPDHPVFRIEEQASG